MKVFVVEEGCYSDYRIVCICSTREKAEKAADAVSGREQAEVREWTVDESDVWLPLIEQGYKAHTIHMWASDGKTDYAFGGACIADEEPSFTVCKRDRIIQEEESHTVWGMTDQQRKDLAEGRLAGVQGIPKKVIDKPSIREAQNMLYITVWALNKQHAIKIANEKRVQWKAENELAGRG
jgi:hypothetical protein